MQNKYDTNVTLEENSSLTYMLKNIKAGSTVLEFGPATGYMTKYLKEEMHCHVYIVEIDADAFEKANVYAEDGICGNAEEREWCEKFQNIHFDYITFADVLEHLVNPWQVLERATKLLKEDIGKILVSIPNIGHNAVLVDLFNNKFEYRKTGIMDNTHLRFFTHDSAVEMFRKCGLYVMNEDAVVFNLEYAGLGNSENDVSENVWRELQLRKYGFVNQFLFTLATKKTVTERIEEKKSAIIYECPLYYTKDEEYSEQQKVLGNVQINNEQFYAEISCDKRVEVKRMMIELFPFPGTISGMTIQSNVPIDQIKPICGKTDAENYCFWGDKIKIQIECKDVQQLEYLRISGNLGAVQVSWLGKYIMENEQAQNRKSIQQELEIERLNQVVEEKLQIIHQLGETVHARELALEEKEKTVETQGKLLVEKDEILETQEKLLAEKDEILETQEKLLEEKDEILETKEKMLYEKDIFIDKVKTTRWFRMFGKRIMKDK